MALRHKIKPPLLKGGAPLVSLCPVQNRVAVGSRPVLRFLSFKTSFDQSRISEHDYETVYEIGSDFAAPPKAVLRAGIGYFKTFPSHSPGDIYFWTKLKNAADGTIYFVDLFFDYKNLNRIIWICESFSRQMARRATKVVIIIGSKAEARRLKEVYEFKRESFKGWKNVSLSICSIQDNDILHDRFVLFDGNIWHFGASAGGMHPGLTAYSGPWEDSNKSLETLLETIVQENEGNILCVR